MAHQVKPDAFGVRTKAIPPSSTDDEGDVLGASTKEAQGKVAIDIADHIVDFALNGVIKSPSRAPFFSSFPALLVLRQRGDD